MTDARLIHLKRYYNLLDHLEIKLGGARTLAESNRQSGWPDRGVYFFRETGEVRSNSGSGLRIVRVGTHGLRAGSNSTLWKRLSQHKGTIRSGGGNHRGSIFRLLVGVSARERYSIDCPTWDNRSKTQRGTRPDELELEQRVSSLIRDMPFLWLGINDPPGPSSLRGYIERNSIALLSNYQRDPIDPPSENWLAQSCDRDRVRTSGLWNSNHVDEAHDPRFLDVLEKLIDQVKNR